MNHRPPDSGQFWSGLLLTSPYSCLVRVSRSVIIIITQSNVRILKLRLFKLLEKRLIKCFCVQVNFLSMMPRQNEVFVNIDGGYILKFRAK